jgi:hypothetical protein
MEGELSVFVLQPGQMQFFFEFETRSAKHGTFPPVLSPVSIGAKTYLYSAANVSASRFISSASAACENRITR